MTKSEKQVLLFLLVLLFPVSCFAAMVNDSNFHSYARVISIANVVLEITSAICIKQFLFLGDRNQTNFQIFNLVFGIMFYLIALPFLVNEKSFYVDFAQLSASGCISKFFFGDGIYSWLQWLVIAGMGINVLYIRKYHDS